jgi:periplasmic protein TonB
MTPQSQPKKQRNTSKSNLIISAIFHGLLVALLFYFAAREGLIGKKLQKIAVEMVKEKKPEPPKPKPEQPKVEPPKVQPPKVVETLKVETPKAAPPTVAPPVVAPPANEISDFSFSDGAKMVNSESNPVQLYKGYMEYVLRQAWNRPDNMNDDKYVAEIKVHVDKQGRLSQPDWVEGSGNQKWDDSVRRVFKEVQVIDRRPPTNFPPIVTIRFDVQEEAVPELE